MGDVLRILCSVIGLSLGLLTLASSARAERPAPAIHVYTMGQGADITEKFGHAALCTHYEEDPNKDRCYNYGTTNFQDQAGLAWDFVRGRARFWVSVQKPETMIDLYVRRDRSVWVQELALPEEKARRVAEKLRYDSLEANRYYRYHHYFDNCTTRVRDILDEELGGLLSRGSDERIGLSYRDLSRRGLADSSVLTIASDLVLGRVGDREPSEYEAMFLPDIFRAAVHERLGAEPMLLYERQGPDFEQNPGHYRLFALALILVLITPVWYGFPRRRPRPAFLAPAVLVLTCAGVMLWGLAVLSPLPMARHNENLLLFVPSDLALLFLSVRHRRGYAQLRVVIVLAATAAAALGFFKQPLWALSALPILSLLPLALERPPTAEEPTSPADALGRADSEA